MSTRPAVLASAFASGVLFAAGLALSGMIRPSRVLAFLDVTGSWDPSLAFVMGGAVLVTAPGFALVRRRASPLFDPRFHLPTLTSIDARLVGGAALFGLGWGLSGYCPGPALAALVTLAPGALVFVASMVTGMLLFALLTPSSRRSGPLPGEVDRAAASPAPPPA